MRRVPSATYRLQLNHAFGFRDASAVLDYLCGLGVSDIYLSPIFRSRPGSLHGYDVVDQNELNPELGGEEDFRALCSAVRERGMGWVQDIVANHMAYDGGNPMLMDVFEKGQNSRFINFFDAEWDHTHEALKGRLLAPFLGKIYGETLEDGEIRLGYGAQGFTASYFSLKFSLRMESYSTLLSHNIKRLGDSLGQEHPDYIKLLGILYVIRNLTASAGREELYDQVRFVKRLLWELYSRSPEVRGFIDGNLREFNGSPGDPESFNLLDKLLSEQPFKFSFWKVSAEEINYRRFFNINELITLKAEDEEVFSSIHSLIFKIMGDGITGLRVDHIDGFYGPLEYLEKLRQATGDRYVIVEKILAGDEEVPYDWPVDGTTGYDFLNKLNGLFCAKENEARFARIYYGFIRSKPNYRELVYEKKKLVTELEMTSDARNIAQLLKLTLRNDRHGSDITFSGLKRAIVEVMSFFPVYRTYTSAGGVSAEDRARVKEAVSRAVRHNPAHYNELKFLERVLLLEFRDYFTEDERREWLHFVMKFQQFTGPLMAKGFEDTLLYVYNRLLSLNEVGGDPGAFGTDADEFHSFNARRFETHPHSMNATSTHDTKRGEDVRARLNVLSEIPAEWELNLRKWEALNRKKKTPGRAPDRNDEYFLYQTLLGAYPFDSAEVDAFRERIKAYIIKSVREAKIHTAWLKPDSEYEEGFLRFIDLLLDDEDGFMKAFLPFQRKTAWYGVLNSLSQTILKMTSPGVPDLYQGAEFWDLSLVDPDNRRPVDFRRRMDALEEIKKRSAANPVGLINYLLENPENGLIKLFLIQACLKIRKEAHDLFNEGEYVPLKTRGVHGASVIAFMRRKGTSASVTVAPRFLTGFVKEGAYPLGGVWGDTEVMLPEDAPRTWRDAIVREFVTVGEGLLIEKALSRLPVCLLVSAEA